MIKASPGEKLHWLAKTPEFCDRMCGTVLVTMMDLIEYNQLYQWEL